MWDEIRNWLIAQGIPAEELDEVVEPPVLSDIGQTMLLSLQNGEATAALIMDLVARLDTLEARVQTLEGGGQGA